MTIRHQDERSGAGFSRRRAALMAGVALLLPAVGLMVLPVVPAEAQAGRVATVSTDTPSLPAGMGTGEALPPAADEVTGSIGAHTDTSEDVLEAPLTQDLSPIDPARASQSPDIAAPADEPAATAPVEPTPPAATGPAPSTPEAPHDNAAVPAPVTQPPAAAAPVPEAPVQQAVQPAADPAAQALAALFASPDLSRYVPAKIDQDALVAFYAARADRPFLMDGNGLSSIGKDVRAQIATAAQDGLSPADYDVALPTAGASPQTAAETELRLAAATLLYARHLQAGRFNPARISDDVDVSPTPIDPAAVLASVATAPDVKAVLAAYAPQYPQYARLKAKLAELRGKQVRNDGPPPPQVPGGKVLRPNMQDVRVPVLRARFGVPGEADNTLYDADLVDAVKAAQRRYGQTANGIVGKGLIDALNDTGEKRIDMIVSNMERWRWLPHEVAPAYVLVNIPEFVVRIYKEGEVAHQTKVVVGKPENPTPLLSHNMEYLVFNPSWNVPPGIARKEYLPRLAGDPYFLAKQGIDVVRNGRVVDPASVDWSRGTQGYSFRQPPGERNALGHIKFIFPNKHSVYLHDTPSRALFAQDRRAFSHGCVRVFEPMDFAEVIFRLGMPADSWSQQRIGKLIGGSEKYVNLKQRFPVHLAYFNVFVDDSGTLVSREDLYGIDAQTRLMLGLDGARRVADRGRKTAQQ
ncbi:L,D-transpeptidase family protein [Ancylobacter sp. 6x-1]|uniref:L,D-transpeptidase family protein n=1 Tax=Ancylobacter crimeensis TaxID=2579147 RepID=A0ABT0DEF4_9HYPH|nr:L,D-transpeptidase family protein [Ancylobacter crimeensis]MCK0198264.1 L,D-transpeptidase family protein [Ancylobacter crimeensis]